MHHDRFYAATEMKQAAVRLQRLVWDNEGKNGKNPLATKAEVKTLVALKQALEIYEAVTVAADERPRFRSLSPHHSTSGQ